MHEWKNFLTKVRWFCLAIYTQFGFLTEIVSSRHFQKLNCMYFVCQCIRHCVCIYIYFNFYAFKFNSNFVELVRNSLIWKSQGGDSFNKSKGPLSKQRQFCRNRLECFEKQCWTTLCGIGKLMEVDRLPMGPKWSYTTVWQNI